MGGRGVPVGVGAGVDAVEAPEAIEVAAAAGACDPAGPVGPAAFGLVTAEPLGRGEAVAEVVGCAVAVALGRTAASALGGPSKSPCAPGRTSSQIANTEPISSAASEPR